MIVNEVRARLKKQNLNVKNLDEIIHCIEKNKLGDEYEDLCKTIEQIIKGQTYSPISLESLVHYLIDPTKVWEIQYPEFTVPDELKKLSPWGFDTKIFEQILLHTKQACDEESNQGAELHAYKLTVLFGSVDGALEFLKFQKGKLKSKQPVHDACLFNLPKNGLWSIFAWRDFVEKEEFNLKKMQILSYASEIESFINNKLPSHDFLQKKYPSSDISKHYKSIIISLCRHDPVYGNKLRDLEKHKYLKEAKALIWIYIKEIFGYDVEQIILSKLPEQKLIQKSKLCKKILFLAGSKIEHDTKKKNIFYLIEYKNSKKLFLKRSIGP